MALWKDTELPQGQARAQTVPYSATRAIAASAQRIDLNKRSEAEATRNRATIAAQWQIQAWQCYGNVGEVNYAFNYAASVLSRVRMHAAAVISPDSAPIEVTDAVQIKTDDNGSSEGTPNGIDPRLAQRAIHYMSQLGGIAGKAPMLKKFALDVQVSGECYLACINNKWGIHSTRELRVDASGQLLYQPSISMVAAVPRILSKATPVGRIWNQHPEFGMDPDSSLRAVLDDCAELILLARLMRVAARSRLNAGILGVPDSLSSAGRSIGSSDPNNDAESDEDQDEFELELFSSITAPVAQEDNAAALVPVILRGPAEDIKAITFLQMSREVGQDLAARSTFVLNRVLQGINAPKELSTGLGSSRYSNAQLIDEQSYKALVEPLALMFADAITEIYLQPLLRADAEVEDWGIEDIQEQVARIVCWYDPSEVVTSVDQSSAANEGWDRNALSSSAWRKANGFSDNDAPTDKEILSRLVLKQVALGPDTVTQMLHYAFPKLFDALQQQSETANGIGLPSDLQSMLSGTSTVSPTPPVPSASVPREAV